MADAATALVRALTAAVEAAATASVQPGPEAVEAYDAALARLALINAARVSVVTCAVVRGLLEQRSPGGLTGEDAGELLRACARSGAWLPGLDPSVLLVVLSGSLGLLDVDDQPAALAPAAVQRHAPVLVAELLSSLGVPLAPSLDAALAELRRAETVELP